MSKFMNRFFLPLLAIFIGFIVYLYLRPLPVLKPVNQIVAQPKAEALSLPWPAAGQAAIGASGYGVLESHNTTEAVPIGSVAKVITALAVLKQKPIAAGSQGQTLTLTSNDVDLFNYYYLKDGSVAKVAAGEQITEYQALQAMLLPSANNIADSLAIWAFGSINSYLSYANKMTAAMGLSNTVVGDTNGFSDTTTSTASDLVELGIAAVANTTIAQIVAQPSAQIPVGGVLNNLNQLLGSNGVNGIKTGNTDKAGSCYLFSAQRTVLGNKITTVGAILGQPSLAETFKEASSLITASASGFTQTTVVHKGQVLGYYQAPWGQTASFKAAGDLKLLAWKDQTINIDDRANDLHVPVISGSQIGLVAIKAGTVSASSPLTIDNSITPPSWHWRIFRK